jgi:hypothetical protein
MHPRLPFSRTAGVWRAPRFWRAIGFWFAAGVWLAACSIEGPPLAGREGLTWQVQRYYLEHASERRGMCPRPAIRTITRTEILEETEDRLVLRLRYSWEDEGQRDQDDVLSLLRPASCVGFATRDFTFAKLSGGGLQVTGMSGEIRNIRQNFGVGSRGP